MAVNERPEFRLERCQYDDDEGEPNLYAINELDPSGGLSRRKFLQTAAISVGLLGEVMRSADTALASVSDLTRPASREQDVQGTCDPYINAHIGPTLSLSFSPDGAWLATGGQDEKVKLWQMPAGDLKHTLSAHSSPVTSLAFSPDGDLLVAGSADAETHIWEMQTFELIRALTGHSEAVTTVAFNADGSLLATGSADASVRLWEIPAGTLVHTLAGHSAAVTTLAFNPEGSLLATGSSDATVKLWEMPEGVLARTLTDHSDAVTTLAFNPDGSLMATGAEDATIRIWEMPDGRAVRTLVPESKPQTALCYSADGELLIAGAGHRTIMGNSITLWEAGSDNKVQTLIPDFDLTAFDITLPPGFPAPSDNVYSLAVHSYAAGGISKLPDFDGDGRVGFPDFLIFAAGFGSRSGQAGFDARLDLDGNGAVDFQDFLTFASQFGKSVEANPVSGGQGFSVLASGGHQNIRLWELPSGEFITCLFDPRATGRDKDVVQYSAENESGQIIYYTLPCGSPAPADATCVCDCVEGTYSTGGGSGGGTWVCTCNLVYR